MLKQFSKEISPERVSCLVQVCLGRLQFRKLLQRCRQTAQSEEAQWENKNRQIIKFLNASLQVRLARLRSITGRLPQTGGTQTKAHRREAI